IERAGVAVVADRAVLDGGVARARAGEARVVRGARVAVVAGGAVGLETVLRAGGARAGAALSRVTWLGRRAAHDGARLERIGRAVVARAVTPLRCVALARRGPADGGALQIGGTRGARPRAGLGDVAVAGRPGRVGRAGGARAGAGLGDVAVAGGGPALDRGGLEDIVRAGGTRPRAGLGDVAVAGGGPTLDGRRFEGIGRAGGAGAGAGL